MVNYSLALKALHCAPPGFSLPKSSLVPLAAAPITVDREHPTNVRLSGLWEFFFVTPSPLPATPLPHPRRHSVQRGSLPESFHQEATCILGVGRKNVSSNRPWLCSCDVGIPFHLRPEAMHCFPYLHLDRDAKISKSLRCEDLMTPSPRKNFARSEEGNEFACHTTSLDG